MKQIIQTFTALCLFSFTSLSQVPTFDWARSMGGSSTEYGYASTMDAAGNIYVTGSFQGTSTFGTGGGINTLTSFGAEDCYVAKYNINGVFQWVKQIQSNGTDLASDIKVDATGNIYIAGRHGASDVDFDPSIGGTAGTTFRGNQDAFLLKLNNTGDFVWVQTFGGAGYDFASSVNIASNGEIYLTGCFQNTAYFPATQSVVTKVSNGGWDIFYTKLNSSGAIIWNQTIGGIGHDIVNDAIFTGDRIVLGGYFDNTMDFNPGAGTVIGGNGTIQGFMSAYSFTDGSYLWHDEFGSSSADAVQSLFHDNDNVIYATGYYYGSADFGSTTLTTTFPVPQTFVTSYDALGGIAWAKDFKGSADNRGFGITRDSQYNLYICGSNANGSADFDPGAGSTSLSSAGRTEPYIASLDEFGTFRWATKLDGSTTNSNGTARDVHAYNALGNVIITGDFTFNFDFDQTAGSYPLNSIGNSRDAFIQKMGCLATVSNTPTITASGPTTFCTGGSVTLTAASSTGVTYDWYQNGTLMVANSSNNYNATTSGNYTVIAKNCAGSSAASSPTTVTLIATNAVTVDSSVCGSSFVYQGTTYTNSGTYTVPLTNIGGCDSIITLNLSLGAPPIEQAWTANQTTFCGPGNIEISSINSQSDLYYQLLFNGMTNSNQQMGKEGTSITFNEVANTGVYSVEAQHFGNAIQFDGINDYAILGTGLIPSNLNYQTAYTMEAWAKTPNMPGAGAQYPLFYIGNSARSGIEVYIQGITNKVIVLHNRGYSGVTPYYKEFPTPPNNQWFHIAVTFAAGDVKIYYNGVEQTSIGGANGSSPFPMVEASNNIVLGTITSSVFSSTYKHFPGAMDEFRVWNYARTLAEINADMNSCVSASATGLSSYLSFNHPNGTIQLLDKKNPANSYIMLNTTNPSYVAGRSNCAYCTSEQAETFNVTYSPGGSTFSSISPISCTGTYTAPDGQVYTQSGSYSATIPNNAGCDSIISIQLQLGTSNTSTINPTFCNSYTAPDGQVYTSAGVYSAVISNAAGCDSTITINLSSGTPTSSTISPTACGSYTAPDNAVYNQSGSYTAVIPNTTGCDSTITINLVINTAPNPAVSLSGSTLTANQSSAIYQWIDCDNNDAAILGAESQSFTPDFTGNYACQVDLNGCQTVTSCTQVIITTSGVSELSQIIQIFPNPTNNILNIELSKASSIVVTDLNGKQLLTNESNMTHKVNVTNLETGIYFIQAEDGATQKFIKN